MSKDSVQSQSKEGDGTKPKESASIQTLIHYFQGTVCSDNKDKLTMPNAVSEFVRHSQKAWR